jgi:hypothetical protein
MGAGINTAVLLWFAGMILIRKIDPTSPASWGMWMILDGLLTGASYFAAPAELRWILPAAWTLGAFVVMIACVIRGEFSWGLRETFCAALAGVAAYFWMTINAEAGVVAGAVAITVAGIPLFTDMWKCPNRGLLPPALVTCVACTLFIVSAYGSFGVFLPAVSFAYNAILAVFLLRKK